MIQFVGDFLYVLLIARRPKMQTDSERVSVSCTETRHTHTGSSVDELNSNVSLIYRLLLAKWFSVVPGPYAAYKIRIVLILCERSHKV